MLNCEAFRMIKPVNCVDDYEAGLASTKARSKSSVRSDGFLSSIMTLIKGEPLSHGQLSKILSRDRSTIAKRLRTQLKYGKVTRVAKRMPGKSRPVYFYTAIEAA